MSCLTTAFSLVLYIRFLLFLLFPLTSHSRQRKYNNYLALRTMEDCIFFNIWTVSFRKSLNHIFLKILLPSYRWHHTSQSLGFFSSSKLIILCMDMFFYGTYFDMYRLWKIMFSDIIFLVWMFVRQDSAIYYIFLLDIQCTTFCSETRSVKKANSCFTICSFLTHTYVVF